MKPCAGRAPAHYPLDLVVSQHSTDDGIGCARRGDRCLHRSAKTFLFSRVVGNARFATSLEKTRPWVRLPLEILMDTCVLRSIVVDPHAESAAATLVFQRRHNLLRLLPARSNDRERQRDALWLRKPPRSCLTLGPSLCLVVHVPASSVEVGLLVGMGSRRVQWVVSNGILFVYPRGCLARSFPRGFQPVLRLDRVVCPGSWGRGVREGQGVRIRCAGSVHRGWTAPSGWDSSASARSTS